MASNKIKGITIEIGGDTTKLGKALESAEKSSKSLQSELKGVSSLLKLDPSNVTLLTQKQKILTDAIEETKNKLNTLKSTQAQVQAQFEKGEITEEQFRDFQREIISTEQKLKSLETQMKEFGSVASQQLIAAGQKVEDFGSNITKAGQSISKASLVAGAGLLAASKVAIDYETAFTGVIKTTNATEAQLANLKQGILDLSKSTASSANDIAAVAEAAGQLGIETDNILEFTKVMVQLGDSTNLSATEAASALAKFANITNMSAADYERLGSVIVGLGNNFATTEADIVSMATRLAATGDLAGLSQSDIMGLATAMSSVGIEAEAGGSAMSKLLKKIQTAVEVGGSELKGFSKVAGLSSTEFQKYFKEDAVGALSAFIEGLNDTERNGKSAIVLLDEMGLTEVRLSNTILSLANAEGVLSSAVSMSGEAWNENTALSREAELRYGTTASKLVQLKNTFTELAVKLGEILLPIIQNITSKISKLAEWFTNLSPLMQSVVLTITAIVAAAGPLLIFIGKIISSVGTIMKVLPKLTPIITAIKGAISSLFTFVAANPIILVITAIIAIIVVLWNKCEWFRNMVKMMWEGIKTGLQKALVFFKSISDKIKNIFEGIINFFKSVLDKIKNFFEEIIIFFKSVPDKIKNLFEGIINFFKKNWQNILIFILNPFVGVFKLLYDKCEGFRNFVNKIIESIKAFFLNVASWFKTNIINPIITFFSPLVNWFKSLFISIYNTIASIVEVIIGLFRGTIVLIKVIWGAIAEWFKTTIIEPIANFFKSMWDAIVGFVISAIDTIKATWSAISEWFKTNVIEPITNFFKSMWDAIVGFVISAIDTIKTICVTIAIWFNDNVITPVKEFFIPIIEFFKDVFTKAVDGIKSAFSTIGTFFSSVWEDIKSKFASVGTWFKDVFSSAWQKVKDVFSTGGKIFDGIKDGIASTFKTVVNGLIGGINKVIAVPFNAINALLNKIRDVSVLGVEPFKNHIKHNALSIPQIPSLKVGTNKTKEGLHYLHDNESVVPEKYNPAIHDDVMKESLMDALTAFTNKRIQNINASGDINSLMNLLNQYLPHIANNMGRNIILDDNTLVGKIAPKIDVELGQIAHDKQRGH